MMLRIEGLCVCVLQATAGGVAVLQATAGGVGVLQATAGGLRMLNCFQAQVLSSGAPDAELAAVGFGVSPAGICFCFGLILSFLPFFPFGMQVLILCHRKLKYTICF